MDKKIFFGLISALLLIIISVLIWQFWSDTNREVNEATSINSPENNTIQSYSTVTVSREFYAMNQSTNMYEEKDPASYYSSAEETISLLSGPIQIIPGNKVLTPEILKNAEYTYEPMGGGTVAPPPNHKEKFINGICDSCDESYYVGLSDLPGEIAFGDLNNDNQEDAVVVFYADASKGGGHLIAIYLAVVINSNGTPIHIYSEPIGDRSAIKSLLIKDGRIIIEENLWLEDFTTKEIINLQLEKN